MKNKIGGTRVLPEGRASPLGPWKKGRLECRKDSLLTLGLKSVYDPDSKWELSPETMDVRFKSLTIQGTQV
jgi:hypothetical protein